MNLSSSDRGASQAKGKWVTQGTSSILYYICIGPHKAKDCPLRGKMASMMVEEKQETDQRMGSLNLNDLKAKGYEVGYMHLSALVVTPSWHSLIRVSLISSWM